jgi:hypothetical protein
MIMASSMWTSHKLQVRKKEFWIQKDAGVNIDVRKELIRSSIVWD